ncbi:MAG: hypothetical protein K0S65_3829 [Labilithrix sp.]|nr:hypothetical protein [Labilithrix sp.]
MLAMGAIASMTRTANAEPTPLPLELAWDAPEGCPDSVVVRRRIERALSGPLTVPNTALARGKIEKADDGRFHLTMMVRARDVEDARTIDAASCVPLAEAFAVVVALAIDPTKDADGRDERLAVETPSPAPAAPSAASRPVVGRATGESPAPRSAPASQWAPHVAFGLGGSIAWGALPEVSPGLVASVAVRIDRFRVGALGTLWMRQNARFGGDRGASLDMVEVGAFGAYMVPLGVFAIGPSANIEATYVRARGFGIQTPSTGSATWPTGVLGARMEARVARWLGLFARADLLFPIDAPRLAVAMPSEVVRVFYPPTVSSRLTLGAEVVFP